MGSYLMVFFRALSLQLGIGSETTRFLMGNLQTSLVLETRQQTRYFFFLVVWFSMLDSFGMLSLLTVIFYTKTAGHIFWSRIFFHILNITFIILKFSFRQVLYPCSLVQVHSMLFVSIMVASIYACFYISICTIQILNISPMLKGFWIQ